MDDRSAVEEARAWRATPLPRHRDITVLVGIAAVTLPIGVLVLRGLSPLQALPLFNLAWLPFVIANAGAGARAHAVEADDQGVRAEGGDRMTWPYIDRIELADVRRWRPIAQVHGRWGNLVELPGRLRVEGTGEHPAELLAAEARRRGIPVVGTRPVATTAERLRGPVAVLLLLVLAAALLPEGFLLDG